MIAIIDYGVGNLFSLSSSLRAVGAEVVVTDDREILKKADRLILPGVGAFADAAAKLRADGLDSFVREQAASGKPLLGICLGMQLLFEKSYEFGEGTIPADLKIPQIGWNRLRLKGKNPLFQHIQDGDYVYFVHSHYASGCDPYVIATTDYGIEMTAAAAHGNVYGCQFHPEKSGPVGLKILAAFCGTEAAQ